MTTRGNPMLVPSGRELGASGDARYSLTSGRLRRRRPTPARDDTQSSAAVLSSRLVSAVGASMSDGPVRPASTPRDRRLEP